MAEVSAREIALKVLKGVDEEGAYANIALNNALEHYHPGKLDRTFATELVYGTLRALNTIDWVLARFLRHPLASQTVWVRNILRMGTYQLLFMNRVPASAACNEAAKLAHKYGHPGQVKFINGVLRNISRHQNEISFPDINEDPVGHISLRFSHPTWLVKRWLDEFGVQETIQLCQVNNTPAPVTVRTNTLKTNRQELARKLLDEGLNVSETNYTPEGLNIEGFLSLRSLETFKNGLFQVQDESSMLVGHVVNPASGARVLDACSAPGGKTTHLAQLMNDSGEIIAVDVHPHKLDLIKNNCHRLGITSVQYLNADSRALPEKLESWADYVLVDAPCSGLGVLRRRPDARWRKEPGQLSAIVKLQREILESAARCVRPGGVLVYSTCTITREENHDQVKNFLSTHQDFCLGDITQLLSPELDKDGTMEKGYLQILPHVHGMDGFYIARMRRKRV
ncbi:16S rRNA (cytosine(967)-C(5))-methyltransferase RsmB [Desulfolucanica intricata]|uniref:16S rRNA (cytosine(967)-C(5))-methyltransferase RsmB n=1 Tax=Desulfolucanica intricata TaxID=1285191 RepID=UPI000830474C|nr:16S rRNA (cytosine(967)-C(5))-methyltransferase RsmB [Desulfolucanica intricata]